jgi:hypothetical protein
LREGRGHSYSRRPGEGIECGDVQYVQYVRYVRPGGGEGRDSGNGRERKGGTGKDEGYHQKRLTDRFT